MKPDRSQKLKKQGQEKVDDPRRPPPDRNTQLHQEALGKVVAFGIRRKAAAKHKKSTEDKAKQPVPTAEPAAEPSRELPAESAPALLICLGVCVFGSFVLVVVILQFSSQLKGLVSIGKEHRGCRSYECLGAKEINRKMNSDKIMPCYDFYLYSCGGWFETHATSTSSIDVLSNIVMSKLNQTIYEHVLGDPNKDRFHGMVTFYRSCYEFHRKRHPVAILQPQVFQALGLTVHEWVRAHDISSIFDAMMHMTMSDGIDTFYSIEFVDDNGQIRLKIAPAVSIRRKLLYDDEADTRARLEGYMEGFMDNIDRNIFDVKTQQVILSIDSEFDEAAEFQGDDAEELVPFSNLPEVAGVLAVSDWLEVTNRYIKDTRRMLQLSDIVIMISRQVLQRQTQTLFKQNSLHLALYWILQASASLLRFDFNHLLAPHHDCLLHTHKVFASAFTTLVANVHVGEPRIRYFHAFFDRVRSQVIEDLSTATWLDTTARRTAQVRVQAVKLKMITPDTAGLLLNTPRMSSNFLKNYVVMLGHRKHENYRFPMRSEVREEQQDKEALMIGWAKYVADRNVIIVPTTMLMAPAFYDIDEDVFINYSAVGSTFFQLLSVAITGQDEYVTPLWPEKTQAAYNSSLACYVDQFTKLVGDKRVVTPQLRSLLFSTTRSLSLAYSFSKPTDTLSKKLFFGRFCQLQCYSDFESKPAILPARAICHVAVQNAAAFFETFKCTYGDRMEPQRTCNVI
ncbi:endothelin-converting enzyme homolog [Ornithodoros turicata]|uniref:endothelin-converting enzyme homolog n=1 Tax=Ornithodoros turicata TaxID=34597 RepID=UPI00313953C1